MKLKTLRGICATALLAFGGALTASDNFFIANVRAQDVKPGSWQTPPLDKDKLEIAKLLISTIKVNSKDICFKKQTLYFSKNEMSKFLLARFPKKIGACDAELIDERGLRDPQFDYHRFSSWWLNGKLIQVTFSTLFRGGNVGGCDYVMEKKNGKWASKSSECWAVAS